ncbi:hypothetical protein CANCADRAFT_3330 [Tortispora caseinolytica NRRL Y-17796]|uniref:Amidophosphoribosyltransferase n=1 Tax=Tortispora caseinolytica NRRL Y-17796 TaxID=767744 RepID=A0A1E4TA99_9ASCO|nr:hypothetical protein CANCADRAFT_3330 [Tortispora caseinolytica NRRL Y-17796]
MCGIAGILYADPNGTVAPELLDSLLYLQHRGQDAAGMVTCGPRGRLYQCKGSGMARDVFTPSRVSGLSGSMGIGHLRYPTAGSSANSEAQPFYVNSPYGIVLAHNGNLINSLDLIRYLDQEVHRHINTDSDSELLVNVLAAEMDKYNKYRINAEDVLNALAGVFEKCVGGYACAGMIAGYGIIGFRDPHGVRPIVLGERAYPDGTKDYMFASESVVLQALGFTNWYDLKPGEAVVIPKADMKPISRQVATPKSYSPDIFEYVYFARPDSVMDGISVYRSRLAMGDKLATNIVEKFGGLENLRKEVDVVIPVPDTSRHAALHLAVRTGLNYREAFVKNRYVGRTFIMPNQKERQSSVRRKLNAMEAEFRGRNVLIVDDSIVRGTTSKEIVHMAREAGAKRVYFASAAPPIRYNHIYGIDLANTRELVGYNKTEEEISNAIHADRVFYQTLDDLIDACLSSIDPSSKAAQSMIDSASNGNNLGKMDFEVGVFNGNYVTGVEQDYLDHLEQLRADNAAIKARSNALIASATPMANGHDRVSSPSTSPERYKRSSAAYGDAKAATDIGLYNQADY